MKTFAENERLLLISRNDLLGDSKEQAARIEEKTRQACIIYARSPLLWRFTMLSIRLFD